MAATQSGAAMWGAARDEVKASEAPKAKSSANNERGNGIEPRPWEEPAVNTF